MKFKSRLLSASMFVAFGLAALVPSIASAAPYHRGHKVCHWVR